MTDDLSGRLAFLLAGVTAKLQARIREAAGDDYLPTEQWRVLGLLVARNGRAMNDLAVRSFIEPGTLTKIVDRMVADGLVYRAPDSTDRRRVLIVLAQRGRSRFEAFDEVVRCEEAAAFRKASGADFGERLLRQLRAMDGAERGLLVRSPANSPLYSGSGCRT